MFAIVGLYVRETHFDKRLLLGTMRWWWIDLQPICRNWSRCRVFFQLGSDILGPKGSPPNAECRPSSNWWRYRKFRLYRRLSDSLWWRQFPDSHVTEFSIWFLNAIAQNVRKSDIYNICMMEMWKGIFFCSIVKKIVNSFGRQIWTC